MAEWELRPLSLGEILDRTFSLYRRHFVLFLGITAIPHLLILGVNLTQAMFTSLPARTAQQNAEQFQGRVSNVFSAFGLLAGLIAIVVYLVAYLFAQGGTIYAVSEIYLGRQTTIGASLKRMWGQLLNLFGVTVLNGLAIGGATLFLIIPGIYVACRLITCIPAALLEDMGARESLSRSWELTRDNAGRSFVIYVLYVVMLYAVMILFVIPSTVMAAMSPKDPNMLRMSMILMQFGSFLGEVLVGPFILIATSVFYYDLRVKKEAFDLQMMINPSGIGAPIRPSIPTMLS
jgi:Membrane domain of glycerophosphoryl diester phosphodiesterase